MPVLKQKARPAKAARAKEFFVANIPKQRADGFVMVYANNVSLASAPYDLALVFGEIQLGVDGKPFLAEKCRVVMSPSHAKALARALTVNVDRWEKQYGLIQLPPGLLGDAPSAGK